MRRLFIALLTLVVAATACSDTQEAATPTATSAASGTAATAAPEGPSSARDGERPRMLLRVVPPTNATEVVPPGEPDGAATATLAEQPDEGTETAQPEQPDEGTETAQPEPAAEVAPPTGPLVAVTAGDGFSCRLRVDGTAECWGDDDRGQLQAPVRGIRGAGHRSVALVRRANRWRRRLLGC